MIFIVGEMCMIWRTSRRELLLIQKRGKLNHLRLDAGGNAATLVKAYDIPGVFFNQASVQPPKFLKAILP